MTPLECAARALYERDPIGATLLLPDQKVGMSFVPWDDVPKHQRDHFMNHARAVLTAIREPSDAMRAVAENDQNGDVWWYGSSVCGDEQLGKTGTWQRMIDAALAEG